jgi:ketosteroid isomerase-like protein
VTEQPTADPIETGLRAWQIGDLDALEAVLAPDVSLLAVQPGPWDCSGRDEVMRLLRRRASERGELPVAPVQVRRIDEHTYAVHSDAPAPEPFPVATRITVTDGRVTVMQQYRADPATV